MSQEISIHRSIKSKHVVEFYSYFEDKEHIYIILEICNKRSLMEMHKRRKVITEPEVRYFTRQIAQGCKFLHENRIVHRDLKLGNLFINDFMEVKVGDFGLATRIGSHGERKMTLCGTPNYIAPEVLTKKGHSYEVDVWSLGCIVYTLLVGKPPFETNDLKETYRKIRHNDYSVPSHIPHDAKQFIDKMLQSNPDKRPTMQQILDDPYLLRNYVPSRLPTSCLTTAPRFDQGRLSIMPTEYPSPQVTRRPLIAQDLNHVSPRQAVKSQPGSHRLVKGDPPKTSNNTAKPAINYNPPKSNLLKADNLQAVECKNYLSELKVQLDNLLKFPDLKSVEDMGFESQDPAASPIFWVSKWVDYTDKYGIGYQLCDNSTGVVFNDQTRIILMSDEQTLQYVDRAGTEQFLSYNTNDRSMFKKITLLKYFKNYMNEHLLKTGEKVSDADCIARLPYLKSWFRTRHAIVFFLTNGSLQVRADFFAIDYFSH